MRLCRDSPYYVIKENPPLFSHTCIYIDEEDYLKDYRENVEKAERGGVPEKASNQMLPALLFTSSR